MAEFETAEHLVYFTARFREPVVYQLSNWCGVGLNEFVMPGDSLQDVQAAMRLLSGCPRFRGRIGFLGFSVGGHIGYLAATQLDLAACALFYANWRSSAEIELSQPEPTLALTPDIAHTEGGLFATRRRDPSAMSATRLIRHRGMMYGSAPSHCLLQSSVGSGDNLLVVTPDPPVRLTDFGIRIPLCETPNRIDMNIRIATTNREIAACYPVIRELRPKLEENEFLSQVRIQEHAGYRLVFVQEPDRVVAVAGFRIGESLSWGRFLYVDDLVTSSAHRSKGYGAKLLSWLKEYAATEGCLQIHLDSGIQRKEAHRFYEREGLSMTAYHFFGNIVPD